jgi:hypothetical protein
MKHWLVLFVLLPATVHAQDAFPLSQAQIVDAPDVSGWRQTATITALTFDGSSTAISFSKQWGPDRWPDVVPPGWSGPLQYTLWLCLNISGQWTCSGFVQFWYGRLASGDPAQPDVPSRYHLNYFYSNRWRPMDTHGVIQPGELIGFLVTSGNTRDSVGPYGPMERSNVVVVPATDRGTFTFEPTPPTPPTPPVRPPPPAMPGPVGVPTVPSPQTSTLNEQVLALVQSIAETQQQQIVLEQDTNAKTTRIDGEVKTFTQQFGAVLAFVGKYVAPAVAAWFTAKGMAK